MLVNHSFLCLQKSYEIELERLIVEINKTDSILEVKPAVDLLLDIHDFTNTINKIIVVKDKINEIQELLHVFDPLDEIDIIFQENEVMLTAIEIKNVMNDVYNINKEMENLNNMLIK